MKDYSKEIQRYAAEQKQGNLVSSDPGTVSLYKSGEFSKDLVNDVKRRLRAAFTVSDEFLATLFEYAIKENIGPERLKDAVDHAICNHKYKNLTIADILNYDKRQVVSRKIEFRIYDR